MLYLACAAALAAFLILLAVLQWRANRRYQRETRQRLDNVVTLIKRNGT